MGHCGSRQRPGPIRVRLVSGRIQLACANQALSGPLIHLTVAFELQQPCIQIFRASTANPRAVTHGQFDLQFSEYVLGDLILNCKDISRRSVESMRPEMHAVQGVDQLGGNPQVVSALLDAALEYILNTQIFGHLFDVNGFILVNGGRIPGDYE